MKDSDSKNSNSVFVNPVFKKGKVDAGHAHVKDGDSISTTEKDTVSEPEVTTNWCMQNRPGTSS